MRALSRAPAQPKSNERKALDTATLQQTELPCARHDDVSVRSDDAAFTQLGISLVQCRAQSVEELVDLIVIDDEWWA